MKSLFLMKNFRHEALSIVTKCVLHIFVDGARRIGGDDR